MQNNDTAITEGIVKAFRKFYENRTIKELDHDLETYRQMIKHSPSFWVKKRCSVISQLINEKLARKLATGHEK